MANDEEMSARELALQAALQVSRARAENARHTRMMRGLYARVASGEFQVAVHSPQPGVEVHQVAPGPLSRYRARASGRPVKDLLVTAVYCMMAEADSVN